MGNTCYLKIHSSHCLVGQTFFSNPLWTPASSIYILEFVLMNQYVALIWEWGHCWINHGLPLYVAINRKPLHDSLMDEARSGGIVSEQGHWYRARRVMQDLVMPWMHTKRIVCGDSYFALVPAAHMMMMSCKISYRISRYLYPSHSCTHHHKICTFWTIRLQNEFACLNLW